MIAKIFIYEETVGSSGNTFMRWAPYDIYNRVSSDFRLDEQLDTAGAQVIKASKTPFPPMSMARILFSDSEISVDEGGNAVSSSGSDILTVEAYIFDTVEIRGANYCIHNLTLCEPSRLLMGVLIDGFKNTQPQDGSDKKSLYTVLNRLLCNSKLIRLKPKTAVNSPLTIDPSAVELLQKTPSPEFTWQSETQLWECLKDIGNTINCIPRLKLNSAMTSFSVVDFDKINDITEELEM